MIVSFRNRKWDFSLGTGVTAKVVKDKIIESGSPSLDLLPSDIKLLFRGKTIENDHEELITILKPLSDNHRPLRTYKIMALGRSSAEVQEISDEFTEAARKAPRIRDDLTENGRRVAAQRQRLGRRKLQEAASKASSKTSPEKFGFGRIETLPNLPDEGKAREILTQLANDPGILACMKKRNWNVGSLAELYPEGNVGQSEVCVMGLNKNKGQQILLRVRTDDLKGFRKILSIRKVLFHELAHNVHSEHDSDFFQLMRQVEKECNELDWTQGAGILGTDGEDLQAYTGGTYRLGGSDDRRKTEGLSARELRARAAVERMSAEEAEEIEQHCGCSGNVKSPPGSLTDANNMPAINKKREDVDVDMDTST